MKTNYIILLLLISIIALSGCEKARSETKTSNGTLIYLPHSDTCVNCETSYIIFDDNPADSVPISSSKKIPRKYRVKGGLRVKVVWKPEDFITGYIMYSKNWCGPKTLIRIKIYDYESL
ncbi:MAG: hypothetical protein JXR36_11290 [Bacteroidales bacterium]|nr:hypothetical protein [Bacteroidales bacterium]